MKRFDPDARTPPQAPGHRSPRCRRRICLLAVVLSLAASAAAHAFSGVIRYTGALGPVTAQHPLRICLFSDPNLQIPVSCVPVNRNDAPYNIGLGALDYFLIGFLDIDADGVLDPDEPYEIFADRGAPPGDPVNGTSTRTDVDFIFGDENLGPEPTATATATATEAPIDTPPPDSTASPSPTATATESEASPTPDGSCGGDCNGDGRVVINELIVMVRIALGQSTLAACPSGDTNGDGTVQIGELIAAVRSSLGGC